MAAILGMRRYGMKSAARELAEKEAAEKAAAEQAAAEQAASQAAESAAGEQGQASAEEIAAAVEALEKQGAHIHYSVFQGGNHMYTWSFAYNIEPIRDWLFRQTKQQ